MLYRRGGRDDKMMKIKKNTSNLEASAHDWFRYNLRLLQAASRRE